MLSAHATAQKNASKEPSECVVIYTSKHALLPELLIRLPQNIFDQNCARWKFENGPGVHLEQCTPAGLEDLGAVLGRQQTPESHSPAVGVSPGERSDGRPAGAVQRGKESAFCNNSYPSLFVVELREVGGRFVIALAARYANRPLRGTITHVGVWPELYLRLYSEVVSQTGVMQGRRCTGAGLCCCCLHAM